MRPPLDCLLSWHTRRDALLFTHTHTCIVVLSLETSKAEQMEGKLVDDSYFISLGNGRAMSNNQLYGFISIQCAIRRNEPYHRATTVEFLTTFFFYLTEKNVCAVQDGADVVAWK